MADGHAAPDLRPLETTYKIIGELRGDDDARTFLAERIADGEEVLITAVREPRSEGNNALNHYAADTKLLSGLSHPNMPRVLEGRWLGNDMFAVITARPMGDTLGEVLSRGEGLGFPRIASVLQDVKGVLDWARENGVVHRAVTVDSLVFERDTGQVLVSLLPTSIGIDSVPGACDDARTIGLLARAMITGEAPGRGERARPIAELRPELSTRVAEETDRMVACDASAAVPDVSAFIGVVAMADALKDGEDAVSHLKAEFAAEQQSERERFDAEMTACRREAAEQAAAFAEERETARQRIAEQETQLAAERAQYDQERIEFDRACEELEQQRAAFAEERAAFEKERDEWNGERESLEARLAAAEQALAEERARTQANLERAEAEAARLRATAEKQRGAATADGARNTTADAVAVPVLTEAAILEALDRSRAKQGKNTTPRETVVPIETRAETRPVPMKTAEPIGAKWDKAPPSIAFAGKQSAEAGEEPLPRRWAWLSWRPSWTKPAAFAAALVLFAGAVAIARHENTHHATNAVVLGGRRIDPKVPSLDTISMPRGGFLTQSAGGSLAARGPQVPLATGLTDSSTVTQASGGATAMQSSAGDVVDAASPATAPPRALGPVRSASPAAQSVNRAPAATPAVRPDQNSSQNSAQTSAPNASQSTTQPPAQSSTSSSAPVGPTAPLIDTTRRDSIIPLRMTVPRRDSVVRRDTTVRRDTVPHDTSGVKPDTAGTGPFA